MAIQTRLTLKGWFKNGKKPVEEQFADLIDSFRHMSDKIGTVDLDPALLELLNNLPNADALVQIMALFATLQQQIDALRTSSEPITILLSENGSFQIPEGRFLSQVIAIAGPGGGTIGIGNAQDMNDLFDAEVLAHDTVVTYSIAAYGNGSRTIFFNSITSAITLKIYIQ